MRQLKISKSITDRGELSLDKYLSDVSKEAMITQEDEVALAKRIKAGDQEALDKLVRANLRFVISVAKQYQGNGMTLSDMISEGNLGLIKAAGRFDETRGFKFISYAVWWVRQSIISAISQQSRTVRLPVNQMSNMLKIKREAASLEQQLERSPTISELAVQTQFSEENVQSSLLNSNRVTSLDKPFNDESTASVGDFIPNTDTPETDYNSIRESYSIEIQRAMSVLSETEKTVLLRFYGIGCQEMTLSDIGHEIDLSKERVRQIKTNALKKMRGLMGSMSSFLN